MRVLVTGARGLLGTELRLRWRAAGIEALGTTRAPQPNEELIPLDITAPDQVRQVLSAVRPDVVVHCAALTNVDACEQQPEQAYRINAFGTELIAAQCQRLGATCVYVSTDYVFDGAKQAPYHEYDVPNPLSVYGRSKLAGEQAVQALCQRYYIIRVAWLYGAHRPTFPHYVLEQARAGKSPVAIVDQVGSPTYVADIADRLLRLLSSECYGIYHLTNTEPVSRYEFARAILQAAGATIEPEPLRLAEWRVPAPRPPYSALVSWRLEWAGVPAMPSWRDALKRFLREVLGEEAIRNSVAPLQGGT
ncbi:MAG: dTDP-4-dehydrorhamnose reductase [Armatimonadota bacterium]|nr:dTDP-4-dehydrorhamnose reductase [Armatimonadota bacterium]